MIIHVLNNDIPVMFCKALSWKDSSEHISYVFYYCVMFLNFVWKFNRLQPRKK